MAEIGFVEGRNLIVEYRWADDHNERLPALAADLVGRGVAAIFAGNTGAALAAKTATQTIPIAFILGSNPVEVGLVASLARPGGNVTGVTLLLGETTAKRLELLHEVIPMARTVALLVDPTNPVLAQADISETQRAAGILGVNVSILNASDTGKIDEAFAVMASRRIGGFMTTTDNFFLSKRDLLATRAAEHAIPAIYAYRENATAGGLTSYGTDIVNAMRRVGVFMGRFLNGENPADMPVEQVTKLHLTINMKTAKGLGLTHLAFLPSPTR